MNQILNLAIEGMRPYKIAAHLNLTTSDVTESLVAAITAHKIKRSQVLATLEMEIQEELSVWLPSLRKFNPKKIERFFPLIKDLTAGCIDLTIEELNLYLLCYKKGFQDGDLYELLCDFERTMHTKIKTALIHSYGDHAWWKNGVPLAIRTKCGQRFEEAEDGEYPPYGFITLGEMLHILTYKPNQSVFSQKLPLAQNKKPLKVEMLQKEFKEITKIRNKVMHPVGALPTTEDEFFFVREMVDKFEITKWR